MPRRRPQPPVRYAVIGHEGAHHVVDQLHGYALSSHTTRPAAEDAAREPACNPTAAIAAVEALDAAQSGPAATERRILRRYGYAWSLRQDEMLSLMREFSQPPPGDARLQRPPVHGVHSGRPAVLHHARTLR